MNDIFSPSLHIVYQHYGAIEQVRGALAGAGATQLTADRYELRAQRSLGTMRGLPTKGIYARVTVTEKTLDCQEVVFTTSVRPEHYFIALLFTLFGIDISLDHKHWYEILFVAGLWLVFHVWFQVVYRSQEMTLIYPLVSRLRLRLKPQKS